jgi:porphobilinogen deaminase
MIRSHVTERRLFQLTSAVIAVAAVAACSPDRPESTTKPERESPSRVVQIGGSEVKTIILSADAAERLGLETQPVREMPASEAAQAAGAIPVAALVYDDKGDAWVYAVTAPHTYVRERVKVARVLGDVAILESGPRAGTEVVTVGDAELLGTEVGVEGG